MAEICLPTTVRDKKRFIQKYDNTPVSLICFDILNIQGENRVCKKISLFYAKLLENFTKWMNTDFERYAKSCYDSDTHPRKKYRYVPIELNYTMTGEIKEKKYFIVDTNITVSHQKSIVSSKKLKHIWNLKTGNLHIKKTV